MTRPVQVAFRTSGGSDIGFGHVRRCMSLAMSLQEKGADCLFLLDGDPEVFELVLASGFQLSKIHLANDLLDTIRQCQIHNISIVVADSYEFSASYLEGLREAEFNVAVLDDLGSRDLPANLVVNGAVGAEHLPYQALATTKFLLGPRYILLRPEFLNVPLRQIKDQVGRVLVTVGGSDPHGLTECLMDCIVKSLGDVRQDVIIGPLFRHVDGIRAMAKNASKTINVHENTSNMNELMLKADMVLCGGGQTTYELAAIGTPAIAVRTAKNQTVNLSGLSHAGTLVWCGDVQDDDLSEKLIGEIKSLASDAALRKSMNQQGPSLVDGQGASRVAEVVLGLMEPSLD